mmetsp:Transcript_146687/g.470713  ORF Transcript_146687/g.470713 Transcript_146687/m.470713 type:complete len:224 (-) Transcript_146687:372-1043(-)
MRTASPPSKRAWSMAKAPSKRTPPRGKTRHAVSQLASWLAPGPKDSAKKGEGIDGTAVQEPLAEVCRGAPRNPSSAFEMARKSTLPPEQGPQKTTSAAAGLPSRTSPSSSAAFLTSSSRNTDRLLTHSRTPSTWEATSGSGVRSCKTSKWLRTTTSDTLSCVTPRPAMLFLPATRAFRNKSGARMMSTTQTTPSKTKSGVTVSLLNKSMNGLGSATPVVSMRR